MSKFKVAFVFSSMLFLLSIKGITQGYRQPSSVKSGPSEQQHQMRDLRYDKKDCPIQTRSLITDNKVVEFKKWLETGVIEPKCYIYDWPLMTFAAYFGRTEIIRDLIKAGAKVNARRLWPNWSSALKLAVRNRKMDTVKLLLENGANPNIRDGKRETPIFSVVDPYNTNLPEERTEETLAMIDILVKHGAKLDKKAASGEYLLHIALLGPPKIFKKLVALGAPLNKKNSIFQDTPLHKALEIRCYSRPDYVYQNARELIRAGADLNRINVSKHNVVQAAENNMKEYEYKFYESDLVRARMKDSICEKTLEQYKNVKGLLHTLRG